MKHILLTIIMTSLFFPSEKREVYPAATVLELFTSQGSSSCPPADELSSQVQTNNNVIALSYHLGY